MCLASNKRVHLDFSLIEISKSGKYQLTWHRQLWKRPSSAPSGYTLRRCLIVSKNLPQKCLRNPNKITPSNCNLEVKVWKWRKEVHGPSKSLKKPERDAAVDVVIGRLITVGYQKSCSLELLRWSSRFNTHLVPKLLRIITPHWSWCLLRQRGCHGGVTCCQDSRH